MMTDMKAEGMEKVRDEPSPVRIGLLVAGGVAAIAGGALLIEELTDLLRGRADLGETFGALVAIAIGLVLIAAGALLGDDPRRLGTGFWSATGGITLVAATAAFGLGLLVDLGTAGALAVAAVLIGLGVIAALVAAVASGSELPDWVWMLDD